MLQTTIVFCFVVLTGYTSSAKPSLQIEPNAGLHTTEIGRSLALTCRPNVEDTSLISQMEWRGPNDNRIETTDKRSPIYIQGGLGNEKNLVLFFQRIEENQAGNYTCTANYATEKLSNSVIIKTYEDISFVDAPKSQYPRVGEDYLVKCKAQGNPSPLVYWNKNGESILSGDRYVIQTEGLLIQKVRESDDGMYQCSAYVGLTGHVKMVDIKVETIIPPEIKPMNIVSVIEGEAAWVKCRATGKPPPTYSWIKETTRQDLSKTDRFDVKQNVGDLVINRVEFNDDDYYKCTAQNQAGIVESKVKINVLVKPQIYELLNVTAPINNESKIICKARGRPTPSVTFRKLSKKDAFKVGPQLLDKRIILEQQFFESKGETFGTLDISKLNRTDDGLYECIAENTAGTSYKRGHIAVEFPPTFERTKDLPQAWAWVNKPGNLTCIPEAIPNATITWKFNGIPISKDSPNFKIIGTGPTSHLIVTPLNDYRFYTKYECLAANKLGERSILLELKQATVPTEVVQIKPQSITATTIKFTIVPPAFFDSLPIRSFTVQYKRERDVSWDFGRNHTWSFHAPYILENLIPETTYHFRFAARNDVGFGPWKNIPGITMPRRSEPAEPKIYIPQHSILDPNNSNRQEIITVSPYADHYELRWQVPNDNGDPIDGYLIRYCVVQKINGEWRDSDCSEEIKQSVQYTSYDLANLKADTVYKIELRATNTIGSSSPAQIRVKTARGIDLPVPHNEPSVTNLAIIGIVVAAVVLVLFFVDVVCFCVNRAGILALICDRNKSKEHEEDPKLGRDEREPLKQPDAHQINGEKNMSVEFDGRHVYSKSGEIIGKHSAV